MPRTIDVTALESKGVLEKRNESLLIVWMSVPCTTDRIVIPAEHDLKKAWEILLESLQGAPRNVLVSMYETWGYPWKHRSSTTEGTRSRQDWTYTFMRVALYLDGFLAKKTEEGQYVPEDVDALSVDQRAEKVKGFLQEKVFDDWLSEHTRIFKHAVSEARENEVLEEMRMRQTVVWYF